MTSNPPKEHNFDSLPEVHALDEFFHRKYEDVGEGDAHDLRKVATAEEILADLEAHADHHIHMPSPSYWPMCWRRRCPSSASASSTTTSSSSSAPLCWLFGWAMTVGCRRLRRPPPSSPAGRRDGLRPDPARGQDAGHGAPDLGNEPSDTSRPRRRIRARCTERPDVARRDAGPIEHRADEHGTLDPVRPVQQQDGHVAVPRLGVPAVRRSDLDLHAVPRPHAGGLGPDQIYDIPFTSVSSFVLLMSSLTMVLAVSAAHRGDERNTRVWLVTTALLGATFVGGQATSSRRSTGRASAPPRACSRRASTRSPASTACTSRSASSCCCRLRMICSQRVPGDQDGSGRDRRPLLALRRHRVDHHLHARLPDPGLSDAKHDV